MTDVLILGGARTPMTDYTGALKPLLKRMVLAGKHGRKTGEGFYKY